MPKPLARTPKTRPEARFLADLGRRIRAARESRSVTRAALARRASLSMRFLAQVETGEGNISITRLHRLAAALNVRLVDLLQEKEKGKYHRVVVSLLGVRGAGKSTLGKAAARRLGWGFVEHDRLVEDAAGMSLEEIFSLHGDAYYRRLARETLQCFLDEAGPPAILATAGGVVGDSESFDLLLNRTTTIWLSATPDDHWNRVVSQGDARPMRDRPEAMGELRRLLQERLPLYARAAERIDTSHTGVDESLNLLVSAATAAPQ